MVTTRLSRILRCLIAAGLFLSAWLFPQSQTQVGYTTVSADPGSSLPVGAALFSFSSPDGVLVLCINTPWLRMYTIPAILSPWH